MKNKFNYFFFFLVVALIFFGFIFLSSLSAPTSLKNFGNTNYYLFHQLIFGLLPGLFLGFIAYKVSLSFLKKWAPLLILLNILVLFLVFIPGIGVKTWGASRWLNIFGFTVQPAEFLKVSAILYLSAWIASKLSENNLKDLKNITKNQYHNFLYIFVPFIVFLGFIAIGLFFQRDASTLGVISLTLLVLYFSSKTSLWHTISIITGGAIFFLLMIKFEPYRLSRFLVFLNPDSDPLGQGWQIRQSLISLGSGGIFGKGLGMSTQKFGYLPTAMSDSIFAIIGEELGIIGCVSLVIAFILFFWLGLQISRNSKDKFSKMVSIGVVFWITFQAFINMSSSIGIFPLTGIPLPFFSYGGSHLTNELIGIGLLLNISKNT